MDVITRHRKHERKRIVNDERRDGSEDEMRRYSMKDARAESLSNIKDRDV